MHACLQGVADKIVKYEMLCRRWKVTPSETAAIGDDEPDARFVLRDRDRDLVTCETSGVGQEVGDDLFDGAVLASHRGRVTDHDNGDGSRDRRAE